MSMVEVKNAGTPVPAQPTSFAKELGSKVTQFSAALPRHIPHERFARVIMTAVQRNPDLLAADRQSLWNSAMQAAADGLLPDGREGALVIYNTKEKQDGRDVWIKKVQWLPMIAGIRKKVRNSGEITDWTAQVVHAKDEFEYELGDDPFIKHKPKLEGDRGQVVAAYSVATLKGGEKSREVMTRAELDKVRAASKSPDTGPWKGWFEEMCRKTVAKRHAKVLPMSTDLDDLIRRDDELYDLKGASDRVAASPRLSLAGKLDALAAMPDLEQGRLPAPDESGADRAKPTTGEADEISGRGPESASQEAGGTRGASPTADTKPRDNPQDAGAGQPASASETGSEDDPRERLIAELQDCILDGQDLTRLLNGLGERRLLLEDADTKALRDFAKAHKGKGSAA